MEHGRSDGRTEGRKRERRMDGEQELVKTSSGEASGPTNPSVASSPSNVLPCDHAEQW